MVRFTTPALCLELETNLNLENSNFIQVTLRNRLNKLVLTTEDERFKIEEGNKIYFALTQEETGKFIQSVVNVQVRFRINDIVYATEIGNFEMSKVLNEDII